MVSKATERYAQVMQRADPVLRQQLYDELGIATYLTPGHDGIEVAIQPRRLTVVSVPAIWDSDQEHRCGGVPRHGGRFPSVSTDISVQSRG